MAQEAWGGKVHVDLGAGGKVDPGPSEGVTGRVGSFAVEVRLGFEPTLVSETVLSLPRSC
jgi:hypothetical protein